MTGSLGSLGSAGAVNALGAVAPTITAPHIQYGQLSPMLLVFGAAVAGVFVEAFAPRPLRRALHLPITLGSLAGAFVLTIVVAVSGGAGHIDAQGAVAVDQPTLFIQGTILVLAFISILLVAESSHEVSAFAAQAAAVPGSAEEREGLLAGISHTEVYPLALFAIGGMLLFPASNDLLTMFVALEVLS
ncbi:MAG TPA: NADH-quinone oxidoreductase subunit N, partial [Streptosporangiaceae bacterium]